MKFKAELKDYLLVYQDSKLRIAEIAKKIKEEHPEIELTFGTIRKNLYLIKRELESIPVKNVEPKYKVVGSNYILNLDKKPKVFSIEFIDQIFLFYSRRGYNFTRSQVQQRFELSPENFVAIQSTFHLSKESDLFSPYTKKNSSKEELEILTENLMSKIVSSGEMTTKKYQDSLIKKYKSVINTSNLDAIWKMDVISEILHEYSSIEPISIKRDGNNEVDFISVTLTDIHAGSKAEKMKITEDWSIEKLYEKLDRAANIINSYKAKKVNINFLGDLVETISGVNHPDSWKLVQNGFFGAKVIIETKVMINEFLSKIINLNSINAVGGNHDRLQASNQLSDTGATDLIFYMLQEEFKNTGIRVNYDPVILGVNHNEFGEILCHGDKGLHKRSLEFIILQFAKDRNKFQFVNMGHLHTTMIKNNDSQHIGRRITCPSILTGNHYSDVEIGKSDKSGILITKTNIFGEPDMIIHNI
jgi:hypothetical protein